jgi:hypothetical protein
MRALRHLVRRGTAEHPLDRALALGWRIFPPLAEWRPGSRSTAESSRRLFAAVLNPLPRNQPKSRLLTGRPFGYFIARPPSSPNGGDHGLTRTEGKVGQPRCRTLPLDGGWRLVCAAAGKWQNCQIVAVNKNTDTVRTRETRCQISPT